MTERDLVILGGGAAGLVVASVASQLGLAVTLIEKKSALGGDCLHTGCVPSKTLIHAARVAHLMRRAGDFGLVPADPGVDLARVMAHVREVIADIQKHDDPERFRSYGCEVRFGAARFTDARHVDLEGERIAARRFVIATGSRPLVPPIPGLADSGYLTNETIFSLDHLPRHLMVLGGGPIGLELAQAFVRLGSKVTVIERLPGILPLEEPAAGAALRIALESEGIRFLLGTTAMSVARSGNDITVATHGDAIAGDAITGDALLVAVGRRPNTEDLGLEASGIVHTPRGITTDARLRTSQKHIYACGDVAGPYPFTHMAEYQAGIVIANAVFRFPKKVDYSAVPWVIYTDPELARVGLSESQAKTSGLDPKIVEFPFQNVDRARAARETAGFVRLVTRKQRLIGATILGSGAGELLGELTLAMRAGASIRTITDTIHAYPTMSQGIKRAAGSYFAASLFSSRTRRLVKYLARW